MEKPIFSQAETGDSETSGETLPSSSPEIYVEATLSCLFEAISNPEILIEEWQNKPMKNLVQMYRDLQSEKEDAVHKYEMLSTLHEETLKELQDVKHLLRP